MIKKIFLLIVLVIFLSQIVFAETKECITVTYPEQDVTGDGTKEQIYISVVTYSPEKYQIFLNIMQETPSGKVNIFPRETPNRTYFDNNMRKNLAMSTALGRKSEIVIDKFDSYKGKQVLIYFITGADNQAYGDFYRYNSKTNMFELYKHDITNKRYFSVDSGKNPPDNKSKIIKEFKGITNFSRAFAIANNYWESIKKQKWENAYTLCEGKWARGYVDSFNKGRFNKFLSKIQNINLKSYSGFTSDHDTKTNYYFSTNDSTYYIVIKVNENFKVKEITDVNDSNND